MALVLLVSPYLQKNPDLPSYVSNVRPIACLDVEGKMLWAIIARRLITFLSTIMVICQVLFKKKGFLPDFAGCLTLTLLLIAALKYANKHKRTIIITFLDLANAYGSLRHNLIMFALEWYHVPFCIRKIIFNYYNLLRAKIITKELNFMMKLHILN